MKKNYSQFIKANKDILNDLFGEALLEYEDEILDTICKTKEEKELREMKIETYQFIRLVLKKMKLLTEDKKQVDKYI